MTKETGKIFKHMFTDQHIAASPVSERKNKGGQKKVL
jgi:hypothetical protein